MFLYDPMHTIAGVLGNNTRGYKRPASQMQPNPQFCPESKRQKVKPHSHPNCYAWRIVDQSMDISRQYHANSFDVAVACPVCN